MVALGNTGVGKTNNVEIIDLSSPEFQCKKFPTYPFATERARGGLGFGEIPLICGGITTNQCKTFENGGWQTFKSMTEDRYDFAITKTLFGNDEKLILLGGYNGQRLATAETLSKDGFDDSLLKLQFSIYGHCMVMLNSSSLILLGGSQNSSYSTKTHILNTKNLNWFEGPLLKFPRYLPGCARIAKNSLEPDQSIIVAGGNIDVQGDISSVEILDVGSNHWRKGPDLPYPICCSVIVEHPTGGVALIGGRGNNSKYLDTIFYLPHAGEDAQWEELPQKLQVKRAHHTAFLVPDEVSDSC
jgi:hypothetical protein